jgi:hypothetical protein
MDRSHRYRMILYSLLELRVALRILQDAACPSYWYNEAYLLLNVFQQSFRKLLGPFSEDQDQAAPPLFLWTLRGRYQVAGCGEGWMCPPALAAGVAGLLVMMPLARQRVGRDWLWVVTFYALNHHAAAHGGEVKPSTFDFLMLELILLVALRCLRPDGATRPASPCVCWRYSRQGRLLGPVADPRGAVCLPSPCRGDTAVSFPRGVCLCRGAANIKGCIVDIASLRPTRSTMAGLPCWAPTDRRKCEIATSPRRSVGSLRSEAGNGCSGLGLHRYFAAGVGIVGLGTSR